jgi:hypothetical protein
MLDVTRSLEEHPGVNRTIASSGRDIGYGSQGGGKRLVEGIGSQVFRTCSYSNEMKDA